MCLGLLACNMSLLMRLQMYNMTDTAMLAQMYAAAGSSAANAGVVTTLNVSKQSAHQHLCSSAAHSPPLQRRSLRARA